MQSRSLETPVGFMVTPWEHLTIDLIGCGGNGSHLVPHLARMCRGKNIDISLYDGDVVEEKNLIRQHFAKTDIGKNKAEVLCARYIGLHNRISFQPRYVKDFYDQFGDGNIRICISCTDSLESRYLLHRLFVERYRVFDVWIDLGNERKNGQVIVALNPTRVRATNSKALTLPTIFEVYPELLEKMFTERSQQSVTQVTANQAIPTSTHPVNVSERTMQSCAAEAHELPEQMGFVNLTGATIATNYLFSLLNGHMICSHMTMFSMDNVFESRMITAKKQEIWRDLRRRTY